MQTIARLRRRRLGPSIPQGEEGSSGWASLSMGTERGQWRRAVEQQMILKTKVVLSEATVAGISSLRCCRVEASCCFSLQNLNDGQNWLRRGRTDSNLETTPTTSSPIHRNSIKELADAGCWRPIFMPELLSFIPVQVRRSWRCAPVAMTPPQQPLVRQPPAQHQTSGPG